MKKLLAGICVIVLLSGCADLSMIGPPEPRYTEVPVLKGPKPKRHFYGKKSSLHEIVKQLEKASLLVKSLDDDRINSQLLSDDIDRIIINIKRSQFYEKLRRTKKRQRELLRRELDDSMTDNALSIFGEE